MISRMHIPSENSHGLIIRFNLDGWFSSALAELCRIDLKTCEILYSGAHLLPHLMRNDALKGCKGDRKVISGMQDAPQLDIVLLTGIEF